MAAELSTLTDIFCELVRRGSLCRIRLGISVKGIK